MSTRSSSPESLPHPTITIPLPRSPAFEEAQTHSPSTPSYSPSLHPPVMIPACSGSPFMYRGRSPSLATPTFRSVSPGSNSGSETIHHRYRRRSRSPVHVMSVGSASPVPVTTNPLEDMQEILDNARKSLADVFSKLADVNVNVEKTVRSCANQKTKQDKHDDVLKKALTSFREKQMTAERSIKDLVEKRDRTEKCLKENILLMLELKEKQDREIQSEMEALFSANKQFAADVSELLSGTSVPEGLQTVSPGPSPIFGGYRPEDTYYPPLPPFNRTIPAAHSCQHHSLPAFGTERGASGPGASSCPHWTAAPPTPWASAGHCCHHGPTAMPPNHMSTMPQFHIPPNLQPSGHRSPSPCRMPPQLSTVTHSIPPQFTVLSSYIPTRPSDISSGTGRVPPGTVNIPSTGMDYATGQEPFIPPSSQGERRGSPTPSFLTGPLSGPLGSAGKVDHITRLADQLALDRIMEAQRACNIFDKSEPRMPCVPASADDAIPAMHVPFSPATESNSSSSVQIPSPVNDYYSDDLKTCYEPRQPFVMQPPAPQQAETSRSSARLAPTAAAAAAAATSAAFRTPFAFDGQDHVWFQPSGPTLSPPVPVPQPQTQEAQAQAPVTGCRVPSSSQWVRRRRRMFTGAPAPAAVPASATAPVSASASVPASPVHLDELPIRARARAGRAPCRCHQGWIGAHSSQTAPPPRAVGAA
ncbi:hypothetical protein EVG20_g10567 [Dentipellis fragilis]|uniref:Uncharacterized protein n=1 Tax=Dentipellis fragilis TaxID=205917 RepID=A0A4Y9XTC2_9AGAM|nr:hypothetical protein EVG20_g10567 [Dentipellis fragilis]